MAPEQDHLLPEQELPADAAAPIGGAADDEARTAEQELALARFDQGLAALAKREREIIGRRNMWLAHHWPEHYAERCFRIGHRHVCRRCAALYPLGLLVAILSVSEALPWPDGADPAAIWLLGIPATVAYCGEALRVFRYHAGVQVATTLIASLAFGRGLGYELEQRWSPEFWGPIAVFGGIWFFATMIGQGFDKRRR